MEVPRQSDKHNYNIHLHGLLVPVLTFLDGGVDKRLQPEYTSFISH